MKSNVLFRFERDFRPQVGKPRRFFYGAQTKTRAPPVANAVGIRIAVEDDNLHARTLLRFAKITKRETAHIMSLEAEAPRRIPIFERFFSGDRPA